MRSRGRRAESHYDVTPEPFAGGAGRDNALFQSGRIKLLWRERRTGVKYDFRETG